MLRVASLAVVFALGLGACKSTGSMGTVGMHTDSAKPPPRPGPEKEREGLPPDTVERAELPFHGIRFSDTGELSDEGLLDELAKADVICIGEDHDNPHDHWAELRIVTGLGDRSRMNGRELGIGFEMFPRGTQDLLEKWRIGKIDEPALLEKGEWDKNWGWDFAYYRPTLEFGRDRSLALVALNAPRDLPKAVAKGGLTSLTPQQEKQLPELDLSDNEHRAWFKRQMAGHPGHHGHSDSFYAAQVVWDESMADAAVRWLGGKLPGRQLVILAGSGHCRHDAIPKRIERRVAAKVRNVRPLVLDKGEDPCPRLDGYDYAFAMGGT